VQRGGKKFYCEAHAPQGAVRLPKTTN
jgi:hypothetical protein